MGRRLYIGNLPYSTTDQDLTTLFSQVGTVENVRVMRDMATGRARGFGFVQMSTDAEAEKAIAEFHEYQMQGRPLVVNEAKPKPEFAAGAGRGFGRGGGGDFSGGGDFGGGGGGRGSPRAALVGSRHLSTRTSQLLFVAPAALSGRRAALCSRLRRDGAAVSPRVAACASRRYSSTSHPSRRRMIRSP